MKPLNGPPDRLICPDRGRRRCADPPRRYIAPMSSGARRPIWNSIASDTNHDGILTLAEYARARSPKIVKAKGGTDRSGPFEAAGGPMVRRAVRGGRPDKRSGQGDARAVRRCRARAFRRGEDLNHDGTVTPKEARMAARIKNKAAKRGGGANGAPNTAVPFHPAKAGPKAPRGSHIETPRSPRESGPGPRPSLGNRQKATPSPAAPLSSLSQIVARDRQRAAGYADVLDLEIAPGSPQRNAADRACER